MKLLVSFIFVAFSFNAFAVQTTFNRLIVFGDSLSDVGTYSPVAFLKGGGKFTTNPGKLWIENIGIHMGLPVKPNRHEGFGIPFKIMGGFNYAQGGARLVLPPEKGSRYTARAVSEQIGYFLMDKKHFEPTDIVFMQGGANDILAQLRSLKLGTITAQEAVENMSQSADDLSVMIANVKNSGARSVVVVNLPMVHLTPKISSGGPELQALVEQMVVAFNRTLVLKTAGYDVLIADLYSFESNVNAHYQDYGFVNINEEACRTADLFAGTSLFCSPKTLVEPGADMNRKYADNLHPSTGFSKIAGEFIWGLVKAKFTLAD